MASTFNAATQSKLQGMIATIARLLGVSFNFAQSQGLHVRLDSPDGDTVVVRAWPDDQGTSFAGAKVLAKDLLDTAGVSGVNVAGTNDIALANSVGDRLSVLQTLAGGGAADHFSVFRVSATVVRVQAHDAAGALVATNTSTVKVYNFGGAG